LFGEKAQSTASSFKQAEAGDPIVCQAVINRTQRHSTAKERSRATRKDFGMAKSLFVSSGNQMDELLPHLLSFPPHPPPVHQLADEEYEDRVLRLLYTLKSTSSKVLASGTSGGGDLLDVGCF
jgi:hypothetical protein